MYLASRDLRFATGRFALIGAVIAMITVLIVMLTGLTQGLGTQSTSALEELEAPLISIQQPAKGDPSLNESSLTAAQQHAWRDADGVDRAEPFSVGNTSLTRDDVSASAAVIARQDGTRLAPDLPMVSGTAHPSPGQVVLPETTAADLGVSTGDTVTASGQQLTVAGIAQDGGYLSHQPVAWISLDDAQKVLHTTPGAVSAMAVFPSSSLSGGQVDDLIAAMDDQHSTSTADTQGTFQALPAYSSERGSLLMMQGFLYGIGALVVISFLTVWSIQRTREVAVLRSLGASRSWVLRDALLQAGAVLLGGVLVGLAIAVVGGWFAAQAVPFTLTAATTALPALGILVLGLAAALLSVRRVTTVDPLIVLKGA